MSALPEQAEAVDTVIHSIGLPAHPSPSMIAEVLEDAAKKLRASGLRAIDYAEVLAARGYAACTLGDGTSRSSDSTSGPERLAFRPGDRSDNGKPLPPPPGARWWGADVFYATLLRDLWKLGLRASQSTDEILRHASDVDPLPAGTGSCRACNRVCRPDAERPGNRLVSGLCPTCYKAWQRARRTGPHQWSDWVAKRREGFTERSPDGRLIAVHTPEPDHDIDLSVELAADMP